MGILQKKCRTTGKKPLACRGKGDQNTDTAFLALRLGVVRYLLTLAYAGSGLPQGPFLENNLFPLKVGLKWVLVHGRLIFIHHQCWEVLPFCRFQVQRCIKNLCPKDPDFYTPLALKTAKGEHLPALVVYTNQSPS